MDLKKYKLGDVGKIITGKTPPTNNSNNYGGEIPFLTPSDDLSTVYVESTAKMLSNLGVRSVKKCLLPPRSVCVSCIGSDLGRVILTKVETVTNQQFNAIIPHSEFNSEYLYYYLTSLEKYFKELSASSTSVPIINKSQFSQIEISLPKLSEQEVIAQCLSVIDRKIALNREINRNLEAMARQLYDYWFVQFDFPDENGKPYKSSGGKMVWNEKIKREIPEGWDCMNIGNYAQCKGGYAFKSKDFGNEGLPVIKIGNIHEDYTLSMADCLKVTGLYNHQFTTNKYDLVIAMTGATIGKFAISPSKYWVNQRVGRFDLGDRPLERLGYLFNSLKQQYFRKQVFQIAGGCAQPNISNDQIDSILILKPTDILLDKYNKTCMPLLRLLIKNILEIELLIEKRDTLLPLLMNGQVSVMPSEVNCDLSHG